MIEESVQLTGFFKPTNFSTGFVIPIFDFSLFQVINREDQISGFCSCDNYTETKYKSIKDVEFFSIQKNRHSLTRSVNSKAIYCFMIPDGRIIYGEKEKVSMALAGIYQSFSNFPFALIEILRFLNLKLEIPYAIKLASEKIKIRNNTIGLNWEMNTLKSLSRELTFENRDVFFFSQNKVSPYQDLGLSTQQRVFLAVDFGTSAIAASMSTTESDYIDLLKWKDFLGFDHLKSIEDSSDLLPSSVPFHCLLDNNLLANNLNLPAYRFGGWGNRMIHPSRNSLSLNNLLSVSSAGLRPNIKFHGLEKEQRLVYSALNFSCNNFFYSLNRMLESNFKSFRGFSDVAITCSNVHTPFQRSQLKNVVNTAINKHGPNPIKLDVLSVTDALAINYLVERKSTISDEHVLIFDFGGGTCDLSVVKYTNSPTGTNWTVLSRIGIFLGSDFFDQILVRISHSLIEESLQRSDDYQYCHQLVHKDFLLGEKPEVSPSLDFCRYVREEKHRWEGDDSFSVKVGETNLSDGIVRIINNSNIDNDYSNLQVRGDDIFLDIPLENIMEHSLLESFIKILTKSLIHSSIGFSKLSFDDINTAIVTGRGCKWPGLIEGICNNFPNLDKKHLKFDNGKKAVLSGITHASKDPRIWSSYQDFSENIIGIYLLDTGKVVTELEWDNFIDLTNDSKFIIVQVFADPNSDHNNIQELEEYLYVKLTEYPIQRDTIWSVDHLMTVKKVSGHDGITVRFSNKFGESITFKEGSVIKQDFFHTIEDAKHLNEFFEET